MTSEQFINGVAFRVSGPTYKGAETFRLMDGAVVRESRSSIDEKRLLFSYHCNVFNIGRVGFKGFSYVFNKRVNVNLRFEDLVEFIEEA
jgi:hypothetical protein